MSIQQTKKLSDLEKRLKLLRQQMYGKEQFRLQSSKFKTNDKIPATLNMQPIIPNADIAYLYQDLSKIGILAFFTTGVQIILFILTKNHILNLNFF